MDNIIGLIYPKLRFVYTIVSYIRKIFVYSSLTVGIDLESQISSQIIAISTRTVWNSIVKAKLDTDKK